MARFTTRQMLVACLVTASLTLLLGLWIVGPMAAFSQSTGSRDRFARNMGYPNWSAYQASNHRPR